MEILFGGLIGAGVVGGVALLIKLIGFTAAGIRAFSLAAFIHSLIGKVAAGSLFALLMSLGATGKVFAAIPVAALLGAIIRFVLFKRRPN